MHHVALEVLPVDLRVVQLDESPVLREALITGTDGDWRGVEDMAQDAPALCAPGLRDRTVELVQSSRRLLRLRQRTLMLLPRVSCLNVLPLDSLPQSLKPVVYRDSVEPNLVHDGLEYALVSLTAEQHDLVTGRAISIAGVELIRVLARRENSMPDRQKEYPVAFAAFAEVDTTSAFDVRVGLGSDPETEGRSEWGAHVDDWVIEGGVSKKLRTSRPGEDRLAECDLDVSDLILGEDLLAARGHTLGGLAGERLWHHTHPQEKGTGVLSDLSKADGVNACPPEANGIKVLVDLPT